MSADEEPASASADTPMPEPQSNKRKASVDGELEKETAVSPKRAKLDAQESDTAPATAEDRIAQDSELASKQNDAAAEQTIETVEQPKEEPKEPSATPRDAGPEPRPSRSPTLSRRPSIPTPEPKQGPGPGPDRGRRNFSNEEKKRGQRLFGGLLSTLSQTTANSQQKKRLEIERRQQERAQQQRVEDDKRRAQKLAKLTHVRKIEQVKFDEQVMHTRHSSLLAQAHSLVTKSEPKLHYLPWKLTEAQEKTRKERIAQTKELIEKEVEQFKRRKEQRLKELGATVGEPDPREDANSRAPDHPPLPPPSSSKPVHERSGHEKDHDDAGYVMVEAEEDTVIY